MVWKPVAAIGAASDPMAPFALGTTVVQAATANARDIARFCRVGAANIAIGATAGITNGVTVTAATGNTWTNDTGVALVIGDYVFLTAAQVLTP
jgi:hypothetical protein